MGLGLGLGLEAGSSGTSSESASRPWFPPSWDYDAINSKKNKEPTGKEIKQQREGKDEKIPHIGGSSMRSVSTHMYMYIYVHCCLGEFSFFFV
jgi:hypothetical protein